MAYSLQSRTVQEAVAPYMSASVPGANTAAPVCRAIMAPASVGVGVQVDVLVTFTDGSTATLGMLGGHIYSMAAVETNNAGVIFFY